MPISDAAGQPPGVSPTRRVPRLGRSAHGPPLAGRPALKRGIVSLAQVRSLSLHFFEELLVADESDVYEDAAAEYGSL